MVETQPTLDSSSANRPQWAGTFLKVAISAIAIVLVMRNVDLSTAWNRALTQNPWFAGLAAVIVAGQIVLGGLRWHLILRRLGIIFPLGTSLRMFFIAVFFNSWVFGALGGDVARLWLARRKGVAAKPAVNSLIIDRVAALTAIALLVLSTAPLFIMRVGNVTTALIPSALSLGGIVAIVIVAQLRYLPESWQHLRVVRLLQSLGDAVRNTFLKPRSAVPVLAAAIAAQVAMAVSVFALSISLKINIALLDCLVLMQPVALITAIPISIGGWGVREAAMITMFGLVGVPTEAALALSIQIGVLAIVVSLPGGLMWLANEDSAGSNVPPV